MADLTHYNRAAARHAYLIPEVEDVGMSPTSYQLEVQLKQRLKRAKYVANSLADLLLNVNTPAWLEAEVRYLLDELHER